MALASSLSTHPHECRQDMLQGIPRGTMSGQHCCPITHTHVPSGQPYAHRPFISSALLILSHYRQQIIQQGGPPQGFTAIQTFGADDAEYR